jgi:hypothetical protein
MDGHEYPANIGFQDISEHEVRRLSSQPSVRLNNIE